VVVVVLTSVVMNAVIVIAAAVVIVAAVVVLTSVVMNVVLTGILIARGTPDAMGETGPMVMEIAGLGALPIRLMSRRWKRLKPWMILRILPQPSSNPLKAFVWKE